MALRIDDYFDEDERPAEERDDEAQPAQSEAQAAPAVPEEEQYREDFIVTNGQRRRRRWRRIIIAGTLLVVVAIVVNKLFVSKKVDKGCVRGYLVKVELSSGLLFDSYECTMVTDYPDRVTDANDLIFHFSVRDQKLGEKIYKAMRGDSVLLVDYVRYSMKMPWRGNTDVYVDSATVMKLPVLRSPEQVALDKATYGAKPDTTKRG